MASTRNLMKFTDIVRDHYRGPAYRDRIRIQRPDPETARELEQMTQAENHRPRDTRRYRACYYIYEKWPLRYVIVAAAKRDRDL